MVGILQFLISYIHFPKSMISSLLGVNICTRIILGVRKTSAYEISKGFIRAQIAQTQGKEGFGFQKFTLLLLHSSFPEAESKFCKNLQ